MKRVLVTGGAGFIGSHLVDRLLSDGFQVTVLDNFSTGRPQNLAHLKSNPNLKFYQADVADFEKILPYFKGQDWVLHLAALAAVVPSMERPLDYYRANVTGTVSVLEASRCCGVKRFVYAASASCYGLAEQFPTPESAPIQPQHPYAWSKYAGESAVMHWNQIYGLPAVSLRFFNVYGPRASTSGIYGAVFGVFLAQKLAGKPFTVVGDGRQTRDFAFVSDVVDAMVMAAASDLNKEIMNVGSGETCSVKRLVELLGGDIVYIPKRPGEPDCSFADTSRIHRQLGWKPKVSFEKGVGIMLQNIDSWRDAPVWDESSIAEATKDWFKYLGQERPAAGTRVR